MTPATRARVIDAMIEVMPSSLDPDCATCDPHGGCPHPHECHAEIAERLLGVIERESGIPL